MADILRQNKIIPCTIIFFSAVLLYAGTYRHEYALDDSIVITENDFTKKGVSGIKDILKNDSFTGFFKQKKDLVPGGRYRPLSLATFAVEYEIFGEKPGISHLINALLYAITGILIFTVFSRLTQSSHNNTGLISIPFICALLFIFHPVHTEVVANIKGRDELLALLLSLAALSFTISYVNSTGAKYLIFSGISLFLALLSKENAIIFTLIIPLTVYFFTNTQVNKILYSLIPLLLSSILFLIIRQNVLGAFSTEPSGE